MNRLDDLLTSLCPDGVIIKPLEECCNVLDRLRKPVTKSARSIGEYPYYGANGIQDYVSDYIFDGTYVLVGEDGSVITPNGNPVVNWAEGKIWVNNHAHIIEENGGVLLRYLFHFLQTVNVSPLIHGNIPKLTGGDFRALSIPVPPLEVQQEIVRILDSFTALTAELQEKLQAELQARKKQYEFYRSLLLDYSSDVPLKKLGETCDMKAGKAISSIDISDQKNLNTPYICFGGNGIRGYVKNASNHGEFPIIGRQGALCGNVNYANGDFYATEHAVVVTSRGEYTQRFLYHLLTHMNLNQYKSAGAQPGLAVKNLQEITAPVPSLKVQIQIVRILDRFETICSDLNNGLPAEIEARQKQYEYYRDKLLTFKELRA